MLRFKSLLSLLLTLALFVQVPTITAANGLSVLLDGTQLSFDSQPQLINKRTMVPLRKIFESSAAPATA